MIVLLCVFSPIAQAVLIAADWFLAKWANNNLLGGMNFAMYMYIGLVCATVVACVGRSLWIMYALLAASSKLHDHMLLAVMRAPISFFVANPVGRIINRFAMDVGLVDSQLPKTFLDFWLFSISTLGSVVLVAIVNPWVILAVIPLVGCFVWIRPYYLKASREIKRLESVSRSPVQSIFSTVVGGLPSIRAMKWQAMFKEAFIRKQDANNRGLFAFYAVSRWVGCRLDLISAAFITAVSFCAIFVAGSINPTLVGLSLVHTLGLLGAFQWAIRQSAEVENQMVGVERIAAYSNIPPEPPLESPASRAPPDTWPSRGEIVAKDLSFSYIPFDMTSLSSKGQPLTRKQLRRKSHSSYNATDYPEETDDILIAKSVLKSVSFAVQPGSKLGVVGRTGAGKSTLLMTLFRLGEWDGGSIMIDGVSIADIGLHDLRKRLSVIPQEPTLFSGSIRHNLDPFHEYTDDQLLTVLKKVELGNFIEAMPDGLRSNLSAGGGNISIGEKQLLCLARALIRNSAIIVLDEATANVDGGTDATIQRTIQRECAGATKLIIAHRLNTIIDSDWVLVMERGHVAEQGHPHTLLRNKQGLFTDMVRETGAAMAAKLTNEAAIAWSLKQSQQPPQQQQQQHQQAQLPPPLSPLPLPPQEQLTSSKQQQLQQWQKQQELQQQQRQEQYQELSSQSKQQQLLQLQQQQQQPQQPQQPRTKDIVNGDGSHGVSVEAVTRDGVGDAVIVQL